MNKEQLRRLLLQVISEIDEIAKGEGEQTVGSRTLKKCSADLHRLADRLKMSQPGEYISGAEVLLLVSRAVRLVYEWIERR